MEKSAIGDSTIDSGITTGVVGGRDRENDISVSQDHNTAVDDEWKVRTWEAFVPLATCGTITLEKFVTLAGELNVDCDLALVKKIVPETEWEHITYTNSLKYLEKIPTVAMELQDHGARDEDSSQCEIVQVSPFEYVWRMWLCGAEEEGVEYRVAPQYKPSPQFYLIFNASIVFIAVGAAVIVLMSLLWLSNQMSIEKKSLLNLGQALTYFTNALGKEMTAIAADDVHDQVTTLTAWMDRLWYYEQREMEAHSIAEGSEVLASFTQVSQHAIQAAVNAMAERLTSVAELTTPLSLTTPIVLHLMRKWLHDSDDLWEGILFDVQSGDVAFSSTTWIDIGAYKSNDTATRSSMVVIPCITNLLGGKSGVLQNVSGLDGGGQSAAVYSFFPQLQIGVCLTLSIDSQRVIARDTIRPLIDENNAFEIQSLPANRVMVRELLLSHPAVYTRPSGVEQRAFAITSKLGFVMPSCKVDEGGKCQSFERFLASVYKNQTDLKLFTGVEYYDQESVTVAVGYLPIADAVVSYAYQTGALRADYQQKLIETANSLNSQLSRSVEVVWSVRDNMMNIIPQATKYRFAESCKVPCRRIPEGTLAIVDSFRNHSSGTAIYPDYALTPVLGGNSYVSTDVDMSMTIEVNVDSIQTSTLSSVTLAVNKVNDGATDTFEVQLAQQTGVSSCATYNPKEPCPKGVVCEVDSKFGVMYRADCPHCVPRATLNTTSVTYLSPIKYPERCPASYQCNRLNRTLPKADNSLVLNELKNPQEIPRYIEANDYSGARVMSAICYLLNFSSFVFIKRDVSAVRNPVITIISIFIGISVGLVVVGVVALIIISRVTLTKIEKEWKQYKESIDVEKGRFNEMIQEVVPAHIFARYQRGQRCVTESHNSLSFAIVDICGFSERSKGQTPRQVVRLPAYFFMLYDQVASKFGIFRLKAYGDVCVFVRGLEQGGKESGSKNAWSVACFVGYLVELLSPAFAHFPQKIMQLSDVYGAEVDSSKPMALPAVRIGIHSGSATSGLVDTGKTPFYEIYGHSLAVCHRMQATAPPGRAHASANFKELLEMVDNEGVFEFDGMRKTVMKGHGAITSFTLRSVQLPIDEYVLHKMKIEYAQRMHPFWRKTNAYAVEDVESSKYESEKNSSHKSSDSGQTPDSINNPVFPKPMVPLPSTATPQLPPQTEVPLVAPPFA